MAAKLQRADRLMCSDRLTEALASWPHWNATEPSVVKKLKGGLTNQSYLIKADSAYLVLRLNAANTKQLGLDRALELQVLQRVSAAGVAPALVYSNLQSGILITRYHDDSRWVEKHSSESQKVQRLARLMKITHSLPSVDGALDLQQRADHYWQFINETDTADSSAAQSARTLQQPMQEFFTLASKLCTQQTLCHNDLLADNLLIGEDGKLIALDWEYAAMGDPYFDLAVVVEGHHMDAAAVQTLLTYYSDRPTKAALQRLSLLRAIYCYLDLLWNLVQSGAQNQAMFEDKVERLQHLTSA